MEDQATPEGTQDQQGTVTDVEQPQGDSDVGGGEPTEKVQPSEEPSGEGSEEITPEHKSYKEMQSAYTKSQQRLKDYEKQMASLEEFGGVRGITDWATYLKQNPRFAEWVAQEQKLAHGETDEFADQPEETREAWEKVRKMINENTQQKVAEAVAPMINTLRKKAMDDIATKMSKKYGDDWKDDEIRQTMAELSEKLPPQTRANPTLDDFEDLFMRSLRHTGRMESYMRRLYERNVQEKKKKSVETPVVPQGGAPEGKPKDMWEAFQRVKKRQGST